MSVVVAKWKSTVKKLSPNTAPLRGRRVFTCACGKVQAGSLRGLRLAPSKRRRLVPGERRDAAQSRPPAVTLKSAHLHCTERTIC